MATASREFIRLAQIECSSIGHTEYWSSTRTPIFRSALSHSSELEQVTQPFLFLIYK